MPKWAIYIIAAAGFGIYSAVTTVDRDSSGAIVGAGSVDAFQVRIGDCFDDASSFGDEVTNLPGVPCADPHDNEAYALIDLTIATYPGEDAIADLANASCLERFESFVGRDYDSSSLELFALYPSTESWQQNDREVICAVYDMNSSKLVGSVKGLSL